MTLPGSGLISIAQMRDEYGLGNPIAMSQLYGKPGIPSSGPLDFNTFHGKSNIIVVEFNSGTSIAYYVPAGFTLCVAEIWGGGGGGQYDQGTLPGGGGGGYSKKTFSTSGGASLVYTVGVGGLGRNTRGTTNQGTLSRVIATGISMIANGGGALSAGGTASGGDVNTTGSIGGASGGGASPNGGGTSAPNGGAGNAPGGGGGGANTGYSGAGAAGRVRFTLS
jgi:hypothetical protein